MAKDRDSYITFYPNDWLADPAVRSLTEAERGLWMDILCLMHQSPEQGVLLQANGQPHTPTTLATLWRQRADRLATKWHQLVAKGAAKCRQIDGALYNKRMVLDYEKRNRGQENSPKGINQRGKKEPDLGTPISSPSPSPSPSPSITHPLPPTVEACVPDDFFENSDDFAQPLPQNPEKKPRNSGKPDSMADTANSGKPDSMRENWDFEASDFAKQGFAYAEHQAKLLNNPTKPKFHWALGWLTLFEIPPLAHPEVKQAMADIWREAVDSGLNYNIPPTNPRWYQKAFTGKVAEWRPNQPPTKGKVFTNPASSINQKWKDQPSGDVKW